MNKRIYQEGIAGKAGCNSVFRDKNGGIWIAYHAIDIKKRIQGSGEVRVLCISPVVYKMVGR